MINNTDFMKTMIEEINYIVKGLSQEISQERSSLRYLNEKLETLNINLGVLKSEINRKD